MLFLQHLLLFKQFSVQSKPAYATDSGANSAWGQTSRASQSRLHMFHKADTDQTSHVSQSRHRSDFTCFTKQTQIRLHMLHKADTGQTSHASQSRHRSDFTRFTKQTQVRLHTLHKRDTGQTSHASSAVNVLAGLFTRCKRIKGSEESCLSGQNTTYIMCSVWINGILLTLYVLGSYIRMLAVILVSTFLVCFLHSWNRSKNLRQRKWPSLRVGQWVGFDCTVFLNSLRS